MDGMKKVLDELVDHGHKIIIYTTRGNSEIKTWCDKHDIPYTHINSNHEIQGNNPGKPIADVYVDDRAFTFNPNNLNTLISDIESFKPWWQVDSGFKDKITHAYIHGYEISVTHCGIERTGIVSWQHGNSFKFLVEDTEYVYMYGEIRKVEINYKETT